MTSPYQLKYLDAIGIPVWVSRDLVSENKLQDLTQSGESSTNPEITNESGVNSSPSSNSVQSLLDSLEATDNSVAAIKTSTTAPTNNLQKSVAPVEVSKQDLNDLPNTKLSEISHNKNLLAQTSEHLIFARGSESADWLVIGYSPESFSSFADEPFSGESGVLLNNMLMAVGIENPFASAYLVNVFDKEHPLEDSPKGLAELKQKLDLVIDNVKPKVILLVGQNSAQVILASEEPLIILRSKVHKVLESQIPGVVTYYPKYLIQKPIDKRKAWEDLKLAKSLFVNDH